MARRLLPVAFLVLPPIGWICFWGERQGFYPNASGVFVAANMLVILVALRWSARSVERSERERHSANEALSVSQERYRVQAEAMPQIIWTANPAGAITHTNQRWIEYSGMGDETLGDGWMTAVHPDDRQMCGQRWREALVEGENFEIEYRLKRASDGTFRWHLVRALPLRDSMGGIIEWIGTCTDIDDQKQSGETLKRAHDELGLRVLERTSQLGEANELLQAEVAERKRIESKLRETSTLQRAILDSANYSIISTDPRGLIRTFNVCAAHSLGYARPDVVGQHTPVIFHDQEELVARAIQLSREFDRPIEPGFEVLMARARMGLVDENEWSYVRSDGSRFPALISVTALRDVDGAVSGYLAVGRDITERRRIEAELKRTKEAAENANHAKSEFLANMSHEIRTPMNGIIGMTDLALDLELSPMLREHLLLVRNSADALLSLVNHILDFSKIEAGKLDLDSMEFKVRDCLEEACQALVPEARVKGLTLAWQIDPQLPGMLTGDPARLRQIVLNLMGNAIKFTSQGKVELQVAVARREPGGVMLAFSISDTGIGIAPENQRRIFEPFAQADGSTTRHYGGSGLGLTISSKIIEQMGGLVSVESAVGRGSTFRFTARFGLPESESFRSLPLLPLQERRVQARQSAAQAPVATVSAPLRILGAEDNLVNQKVIRAILARWGHELILVNNGREAVARHAVERFDIILMDIQMPEMDGFEATASIRRQEAGSGVRTPIVAMTAHAMKGDRDRCLEAGMDDYISKPLDSRLLHRILNHLAAQSVRSASGKTDALPGSQIVGRAALLEELGDDEDLLGSIIDIFLESVPESMAKIRTALLSGDSAMLDETAHCLEDSVAQFGASQAVELTQKLASASSGSDMAQTTHLFNSLEKEMEQVCIAVRALA